MPNRGEYRKGLQLHPAAHLGLPGELSRGGGALGCIVTGEIKKWKTGTSGHVRGNLSVRSGRIVVRVTGVYHVYSQIGSEYRNTDSTSKPAPTHSMMRDNPSLKVIADELLTGKMGRCKELHGGHSADGGSSISRMTSYVGAALLLLRGDEVYVTVACIDDLKGIAAETYFGMHMV